MTMRTRSALVCECGQTGAHVLAENDQPYSTPWERNSLEGFFGGGEKQMDPAQMYCPACKQTGKVRYA